MFAVNNHIDAGSQPVFNIKIPIALLVGIGTALAALFPTSTRYTGASLTFNLAGIVGASLAPSIATSLANAYGLNYVGYYLSGAGMITLIAWILIKVRT